MSRTQASLSSARKSSRTGSRTSTDHLLLLSFSPRLQPWRCCSSPRFSVSSSPTLQLWHRRQLFHYTTNAHTQYGRAYNPVSPSRSSPAVASSSSPTKPTPSTSRAAGPAASRAVTAAPLTPTVVAATPPGTAAAPSYATASAALLQPPWPRSPWDRTRTSMTSASSTATT